MIHRPIAAIRIPILDLTVADILLTAVTEVVIAAAVILVVVMAVVAIE